MITLFIACTQQPTDTAINEGDFFSEVNKITDRVESIEPERYFGTWFEQASIGTGVQARCTGTQASYTPNDDDTILVKNFCFIDSLEGEYNEVTAIAEAVDDSFSHLLVTFFGSFEANYYIYEIDGYYSADPYEWAIVTSDSGALWILTRDQQIEDSFLNKLYNRLDERGWDTSEINRTIQPPE